MDMPDIPALLDGVTNTLGPWTYALVGVLVFMETVAFAGLLAPGEITLLAGGAAAANGAVDLAPLLVLVLVAGVLGDLTGFHLGRRYGWPLLVKVAPRLRLDPTVSRPRSHAGAARRSSADGSWARCACSRRSRRGRPAWRRAG
jgi:membrane protein DedA with SNARE-associated domain